MDITAPTLTTTNAYHTARLTPEWTGTDSAKTAAIIRAIDYITATFTFADDVLPTDTRLQTAVMALAPFAISAPLTSQDNTRDIVEETVSGDGVGSATTKYGERPTGDRFPFLRGILGDAIKQASNLATITVGKATR